LRRFDLILKEQKDASKLWLHDKSFVLNQHEKLHSQIWKKSKIRSFEKNVKKKS
jgi:hypothetical protein